MGGRPGNSSSCNHTAWGEQQAEQAFWRPWAWGFGQREEGPQSWNLSQAHCPSRGKEALGLQAHIPTSCGKHSGKQSQAWSQFPHLYSRSSRLAVVASYSHSSNKHLLAQLWPGIGVNWGIYAGPQGREIFKCLLWKQGYREQLPRRGERSQELGWRRKSTGEEGTTEESLGVSRELQRSEG